MQSRSGRIGRGAKWLIALGCGLCFLGLTSPLLIRLLAPNMAVRLSWANVWAPGPEAVSWFNSSENRDPWGAPWIESTSGFSSSFYSSAGPDGLRGTPDDVSAGVVMCFGLDIQVDPTPTIGQGVWLWGRWATVRCGAALGWCGLVAMLWTIIGRGKLGRILIAIMMGGPIGWLAGRTAQVVQARLGGTLGDVPWDAIVSLKSGWAWVRTGLPVAAIVSLCFLSLTSSSSSDEATRR